MTFDGSSEDAAPSAMVNQTPDEARNTSPAPASLPIEKSASASAAALRRARDFRYKVATNAEEQKCVREALEPAHQMLAEAHGEDMYCDILRQTIFENRLFRGEEDIVPEYESYANMWALLQAGFEGRKGKEEWQEDCATRLPHLTFWGGGFEAWNEVSTEGGVMNETWKPWSPSDNWIYDYYRNMIFTGDDPEQEQEDQRERERRERAGEVVEDGDDGEDEDYEEGPDKEEDKEDQEEHDRAEGQDEDEDEGEEEEEEDDESVESNPMEFMKREWEELVGEV